MRIGLLTSGGDAPGMNACIRAVVRNAISNGIVVVGFNRGYQGILDEDWQELNRQSVSNIIHHGGTFLKTDRCKDWNEKYARLKAERIFKKIGIDALVVIGGDGSFRGAADLARDTEIPVIGIPASIDNDMEYTDYTLGFDTAVNNALWAINNLRDTMQSHNKVTFVEVMGRECGDIALHAGIAGGVEHILVPEVPFNLKEIAEDIAKSAVLGKKSNMIIMAEGAGKMEELCEEFEKISGITPRQTRLGFIQRGGSPTYFDRMLACRFGIYAVDLLRKGAKNRVVGIKGSQVFDEDIFEAIAKKKTFDQALYESALTLT